MPTLISEWYGRVGLHQRRTLIDANSLPGADRIALRTGAKVVANGEAIQELRKCGVPEEQLIPVSGGERIPLFPRHVREQASRGEIQTSPGPPGAPPQPHFSLAAADVHVWPSLHCLLPGKSHEDIPDVMDTGKSYTGEASQYVCSLDLTFGMKYGLMRLGDHIPREAMDEGTQSFVDYISRPSTRPVSHFDGGQLSYNFLLGGDKVIFWSGHLGGYDGILRIVQPQPRLLIQALAGRANLNGRPFNGSAAEFAVQVSRLLGEPEKVIWCLHDESPIKPWRVDVQPATKLLEEQTRSRVLALQPARTYGLFEASQSIQ